MQKKFLRHSGIEIINTQNQLAYKDNLDEFSEKELYKYNNKITVVVI